MERATEAGTVLVFMPTHPRDTVAAVTRALADDGLTNRVCAYADALERHLTDPAAHVGAVLVSKAALHHGGTESLERFKEQEPAWSSLPIVVLAPDDGGDLPALADVVLLRDPTPRRELRTVLRVALGFRTRQRDLTRLHERLERMALADPLTGLPNRTALYQHLVALQQGRRVEEDAYAVIFLDLNDFKGINDAYGHAAGDEALRQVARHLQRAVRTDDLVARFAGDEFVAVLTGVDCVQRAHGIAERLSLGVPVRFEDGPESVTVSACAGIVDADTTDTAPDAILARADGFMYARKRHVRRELPATDREAPPCLAPDAAVDSVRSRPVRPHGSKRCTAM